MKRVLYLGYLIAPDKADEYQGISIAGNKMQWNVVKNLAKNDDVEITCVTITPHAAFPHEGTIWSRGKVAELVPGVRSHEISFCNLPVIKQFWQIFSVYHTAMRLMKKREYDVVFCFNLFPQIGIPARWIKKRYSGIDMVCLLADFPIDDNTNRMGGSTILRRIFEQSTWKSMKLCDRYIVLNKHGIDKYLPGKSHIVVDGGVDEDDIKRYDNPAEKCGEHNILFCGALTEYNGVLKIIEAMEYLGDTDIVLDIYGGGYLEETVKMAAIKNPKIRFHGRVSNSEAMQRQREAWLLINPRLVEDPIAQVTFPSKTFEYLLSGTPVLSSHLNGYGKEYNRHIIFVEGERPVDYANKIREILLTDKLSLQKLAKDAQTFVKTEKNWDVQAEKIYRFLMR